MSGIFYDPASNRLRVITNGQAPAQWALVTHNTAASDNHCRRILREWLSPQDVRSIDFGTYWRP